MVNCVCRPPPTAPPSVHRVRAACIHTRTRIHTRRPSLIDGFFSAFLPHPQLSGDIGYVLYSALGSFYIPSCIMVFVYIRIYFAAKARARRGIKKKPNKQQSQVSGGRPSAAYARCCVRVCVCVLFVQLRRCRSTAALLVISRAGNLRDRRRVGNMVLCRIPGRTFQ